MTRRRLYQLANNAVPQGRRDIPNVPDAANKHASVTAKVRDNRPKTGEPAMADTVALVTISSELGTPLDTLLRRLGDRVLVNDAGLRAVSVADCAAYIAEHHAALARRRAEVAAKIEADKRKPNPLRERVRRLAQRPQPADDSLDAFGAMLAFDRDNALNRSSAAMDDMLSSTGLVYRKITERD